MTKQEINRAFNGRWRMVVENTNSHFKDIIEIKELCKDFFEAGALVQEGLMCIVNEDENDLIDSFQRWWDLYDKKRLRDKCYAKWKKLSTKDRIDCYHNTPAYVRATPDKQYRKDPITFLNNKSWNDEIIRRVDTPEEQRLHRLNEAARVIASYPTKDNGSY